MEKAIEVEEICEPDNTATASEAMGSGGVGLTPGGWLAGWLWHCCAQRCSSDRPCTTGLTASANIYERPLRTGPAVFPRPPLSSCAADVAIGQLLEGEIFVRELIRVESRRGQNHNVSPPESSAILDIITVYKTRLMH